MGSTLSRWNNRLSFDFADYLREREELANLLRKIVESSVAHRQRQEKIRLVNGATSVTCAVAGTVVAVIAAPATFGLSLPVAATTAGIVGNSIAAASITSSAASYGHGYMVSKDIVRQVENLQCMVDSISAKDEELRAIIKRDSSDADGIGVITQARKKFDNRISFTDNDKAKSTSLAAWSILSPGTYSILQGKTQFKSEHDFEEALVSTADKITEKTNLLRKMSKTDFKYVSWIPSERQLSRGRLTFVEGGGGCTRVMTVQYRLMKEDCVTESDSSRVIRLPEGASNIRVSFYVKGGRTVKEVDRSHPKQPWTKTGKVDIFDFEYGDGVDAVFYLTGSFTHSYVHKAWDFGRHCYTKPRKWEWWPLDTLDEDQKRILPDSEKRVLGRSLETGQQPCGLLCCGSGTIYAAPYC